MNTDKHSAGPSGDRQPISKQPEIGVSPRLLLLARHGTCGTTDLIGTTDAPLTDEGRKQAAALADVVASRKPARCFCSPLRRCLETASLALAGTQLRPEIDDDLREVDFGRWEGRSFEEIARTDPEAVNRLARFDRDFAFPGGESLREFLKRVRRATRRMSGCGEGPVLAFTHGGVIGAAICQVLGLHPRKYLLFPVEYASLARLQVFGNRGVLVGLNETGCGTGVPPVETHDRDGRATGVVEHL